MRDDMRRPPASMRAKYTPAAGAPPSSFVFQARSYQPAARSPCASVATRRPVTS